MPLKFAYHLDELQRSTVHRLLQLICVGGDLEAYLQSVTLEQSTALHQVMDLMSEPIPEQPLWRTFSEEVQEEIVTQYMDVERIDKYRAHEDLDQITDFHEVARYASDPLLMASVYNYDCCVDDFRGAEPDEDDLASREEPEVQHWRSWGLMKDLGMVDEEGPTELGIEHILWDDQSQLLGPHQVQYRTAGIGGEWINARDALFNTYEPAKLHKDKLVEFYGPQTEYRIVRKV